MNSFTQRITAELRSLVGEPLIECGRAANMQMFGFGRLERRMNRKGNEVEVASIALHIQTRWRLVDESRIIFGRDDLNYPADVTIPLDEFDWDTRESVLDVSQRDWFIRHSDAPLRVVDACGDEYGGFRIALESNFALEAFPCDTRRGEYSEHWRLFGHRPDGSHFVVTGGGILGQDAGLNGGHSQ